MQRIIEELKILEKTDQKRQIPNIEAKKQGKIIINNI